MENSIAFCKKLKILTTWSSDLIPGHIFRENHNSKGEVHPNFHCSTIYNSQDTEAASIPTDRGLQKIWHIYIYTHTHIHIYTHTQIYTYTHIYTMK